MFLPSVSSHKVKQIFLIFSPKLSARSGLCGWKCQSLGSNHFGPVGRQEQRSLQRVTVGLFRCSVWFKLFPFPPHAEEIIIINLRSGQGIKNLSASVTIKEGFQWWRGGVNMKKIKIKSRIVNHCQNIHRVNQQWCEKSLIPHPFFASIKKKRYWKKHDQRDNFQYFLLSLSIKKKQKNLSVNEGLDAPTPLPLHRENRRLPDVVELIHAGRCVCGVTSAYWYPVRGRRPWRGFSDWWVWHHPWLRGPGRWGQGRGLSWPGCGADWRAGRGAGGDRPRWTSVFCDPLPP